LRIAAPHGHEIGGARSEGDDERVLAGRRLDLRAFLGMTLPFDANDVRQGPPINVLRAMPAEADAVGRERNLATGRPNL
jgi:hypothetical protein